MSDYERKRLLDLVELLRAKAVSQAQKSEANENRKGWFQAGQAEGFGWSADHLETLVKSL